jgi:hypothetical protein
VRAEVEEVAIDIGKKMHENDAICQQYGEAVTGMEKCLKEAEKERNQLRDMVKSSMADMDLLKTKMSKLENAEASDVMLLKDGIMNDLKGEITTIVKNTTGCMSNNFTRDDENHKAERIATLGDTIREIHELNDRACNIMIRNIDEFGDARTMSEEEKQYYYNEEKNCVVSLLSVACPSIMAVTFERAICDLYRMGKWNPKKPRAIVVRFYEGWKDMRLKLLSAGTKKHLDGRYKEKVQREGPGQSPYPPRIEPDLTMVQRQNLQTYYERVDKLNLKSVGSTNPENKPFLVWGARDNPQIKTRDPLTGELVNYYAPDNENDLQKLQAADPQRKSQDARIPQFRNNSQAEIWKMSMRPVGSFTGAESFSRTMREQHKKTQENLDRQATDSARYKAMFDKRRANLTKNAHAAAALKKAAEKIVTEGDGSVGDGNEGDDKGDEASVSMESNDPHSEY